MSSNRKREREDNKDRKLDAPSFRLPDNFDTDRYELWTVRLPRDVDLASLNGCRVEGEMGRSSMAAVKNKNGDKEFSFQFGETVENESFRLLLPRASESSDDESFDKDTKFLYPVRAPFKRHVTVVPVMDRVGELDVAPSAENAPEPVEPLRHAYSAVAQKIGLKRRWTPLGASAAVAIPHGKYQNKVTSRKKKKSMVKEELAGPSNGTENGATSRKIKEEDEALVEKEESIKVEDGVNEDSHKKKKKSKKEKKAKKEKKKKKKKDAKDK